MLAKCRPTQEVKAPFDNYNYHPAVCMAGVIALILLRSYVNWPEAATCVGWESCLQQY